MVEGGEDVVIDPRLVVVVERLIDRCCDQGEFEQAVGVAIEGRRLDKLEEVIIKAASPPGGMGSRVLSYALRCAQDLVLHRDQRQRVLRMLVRLAEEQPSPDWVGIAQCLMLLGDAQKVGKILSTLLASIAEVSNLCPCPTEVTHDYPGEI